jgi:hypothetical protein
MAPNPQTPSKKDHLQQDLFDTKIDLLSKEWDLGIQPKTDYSPEKTGSSLGGQCIQRIKFLHHKKAFDPALQRFRTEATILYSGWVQKPKADRGVVPEATRNKPRPVTETERVQLLKLLLRILKEDIAKYMKEHPFASPLSGRLHGSQNIDDRPVPISLGSSPGSDSKRHRDEEPFSDPVKLKKPRKPDSAPVPTASKSEASGSTSAPSRALRPPAAGSMLPPDTKSANTSFASDGSSVFSRRLSYNSSWQPGTQETVPEEDLVPHTKAVKDSFMNPQPDKASSTDYGTSSFEERMADVNENALGIRSSPEPLLADEGEGEGLSQDLLGMAVDDGALLVDSGKEFQDSLLPTEKEFQDRLRDVFCKYPLWLQILS